ncbi:MAG TPA: alpha/beta hydrolase domain-containing protein [Acetobacteraceae bacterium]|nr:alpha/beta hydrolase domain-containing protein [Acetobacteraceae bacterium]
MHRLALHRRLSFIVGMLLLGLASAAQARITRLEVLRTEPAFGGEAFGAVGAYQHVLARAHGELDPAEPRNAVIQDLDLAPRNARGMVEYATEVEILRPADQARGNGVLLFEVNNRGNKLALPIFNAGVTPGLQAWNTLSSPGDGWLMRQGYTLVWWGWEMDVRPGWSRLLMPEIVARARDGSPLTGTVRSEMITSAPASSLPLSRSQQVLAMPPGSFDSYPAVGTDNRTPAPDGFLPTLTVRARAQDPRVPIPNAAWSFATCGRGGEDAKPDPKHLCLPAGFEPGHLYELIYRARDPLVLGIGFAAARDLGTFLGHDRTDQQGAVNPVWREGQKTIIEGSSQSGRMIRSLIALGFNEDEGGARVFDGAMPHIGGGLMPLNVRFGQPYRAWGEQTDHLYPAYEFPFAYLPQHDPLTGRSAGLLDRCTASATCPRVFHVATALEMWEGRQSLGLTDPLGSRDLPEAEGVRTYIMASTQHGPAPAPLAPPGVGNACQQQSNPNPQRWTMRALLADFTAWVRDGVEPPPSAVPRIADGTLVAPDQVKFPPIPANAYGGVPRPATVTTRVIDTLHVLDFGPLFRPGAESGVITIEPPRVGTASYGVLAPQVDADGNDVGGIRSVFLQAPIGTYTGWNIGRAGRFEGGLCNLQGSFIPFAPDRAAREAVDDPRPSLAERYPDQAAYAGAFRAGAERLVAQRFLLPDDARALVAAAERDGIAAVPWAAQGELGNSR